MIEEDILSASSRFERKYRCTPTQYYAIKNALSPYINQDYYTRKKPKSRYLVRSLYFDADHYPIYFEKVGGNSDRLKYRIRTYSDKTETLPDIRVEMKVREGNLTRKYGSYVDMGNCDHFLIHKHWREGKDPVLQEFERHVHLMNLKPKVLVEYHREGYEALDGSGTRLTFDHRIRSVRSNNLFPKTTLWHTHYEQMIVFEIKHTNPLPYWINYIIKGHGLKLISNSKFAFGIQASRHDIIYPN